MADTTDAKVPETATPSAETIPPNGAGKAFTGAPVAEEPVAEEPVELEGGDGTLLGRFEVEEDSVPVPLCVLCHRPAADHAGGKMCLDGGLQEEAGWARAPRWMQGMITGLIEHRKASMEAEGIWAEALLDLLREYAVMLEGEDLPTDGSMDTVLPLLAETFKLQSEELANSYDATLVFTQMVFVIRGLEIPATYGEPHELTQLLQEKLQRLAELEAAAAAPSEELVVCPLCNGEKSVHGVGCPVCRGYGKIYLT